MSDELKQREWAMQIGYGLWLCLFLEHTLDDKALELVLDGWVAWSRDLRPVGLTDQDIQLLIDMHVADAAKEDRPWLKESKARALPALQASLNWPMQRFIRNTESSMGPFVIKRPAEVSEKE
jgi:hypothetical protein